MRRLLVPLALLLSAAFCVWVYYAPHLTVRAMQRAVERGDAAALARHVDFPAVREDLKAQFATAASARFGGDGRGGWRDVGAALASTAAAPAIDAIASEQGLLLLFAGRGLAREWLPAPAAPSRADVDVDVDADTHGSDLRRIDAGYTDASTFVVRADIGGDPALPATLTLRRHRGLWWKLSGIALPLGKRAEDAGRPDVR
jgi:hypothetical protein